MVLQKLEKLVEDVGEMACLFQSVLATIHISVGNSCFIKYSFGYGENQRVTLSALMYFDFFSCNSLQSSLSS